MSKPESLLSAFSNKRLSVVPVITGGVFLYLMATLALETQETGERMVLARYLNFVLCGFFAFVIPHLKFPDNRSYLLKRLNFNGKQLTQYTITNLFPLFGLIATGFFIIAFFDITSPSNDLAGKALIFVYGTVFSIGTGLTAMYHYSTIGRKSQEWQEGKKGEKMMSSMKQVGAIPSVPPGSFPSLLTTTSLTTICMLAVVGGAYIGQISGLPVIELLPAVLLLAYSGGKFISKTAIFDAHFYQTNAFYSELFLNPRAVAEGRAPLAYESLYWVPARWKTGAWFSLLQLDRKQPMGRLLIVAHLVLWLLFYSGLSDTVIFVFILLMIIGKCMALYRLISKPFAPLLFQYKMLPPADWIVVRFFVNLRWIPLLALSLWLVSLFSARVDSGFILYWLTIDVIISAVTAILFTILHEFRIKTAYA